MTEAKVVAKQFTFNIAESVEPTVELIQLMSQAILHYEHNGSQTNIVAAIEYFNSLYGVK